MSLRHGDCSLVGRWSRITRSPWGESMSYRPAFTRAPSARALTLVAVGLALTTLAPCPAAAQVSGRVILHEGPIGVDIVFGPRPSVVVEYGDRRYDRRPARTGSRVVVVDERRPVRYQQGMSLRQLEHYLAWVEGEYRYFKRLRPYEAYDRFGWTERDLDRYVDWLKDERKFLKRERKELRKLYRGHRGGDWDDDDWDDDWDDDDWDDDDDRWERDDDRRDRRPRAYPGRGRGR